MTTSGSLLSIFVIVLFAFLPQPKSPAATKLKFELFVSTAPNDLSIKIPNVISPNERNTTKNNCKLLFLSDFEVENKSKSILHS